MRTLWRKPRLQSDLKGCIRDWKKKSYLNKAFLGHNLFCRLKFLLPGREDADGPPWATHVSGELGNGHLNNSIIIFESCFVSSASLKTDLLSDTFLVGRGKTQPAPQVRNQNLQSRFLWLILFSGRGWSMLVCLWLTMTSTSCHETSSTSSGLCPLLVA